VKDLLLKLSHYQTLDVEHWKNLVSFFELRIV